MLDRNHVLALFMEGAVTGDAGKMGIGILRYSPNKVACVVDSTLAGGRIKDFADVPRDCPIVANVAQARALGADVFVLGIAPSGGQIPQEWRESIEEGWQAGMSIVNGLHEPLEPSLEPITGQWVWDIRQEPTGLSTGSAQSAKLKNRRVLMIGTDMAVGKMTAGLEIWRAARAKAINAEFIATGQIGITVTGRGVPLDAVKVDFATGAIEKEVMAVADSDLVIVEGQGSLIHPGSTANLPLLRGSCPTHLVLCIRARQVKLMRVPEIEIPPLEKIWKLYEDLGEAGGVFPRPKTVGICVNLSPVPIPERASFLQELEHQTGLPCVDPLTPHVERIVDAIMA